MFYSNVHVYIELCKDVYYCKIRFKSNRIGLNRTLQVLSSYNTTLYVFIIILCIQTTDTDPSVSITKHHFICHNFLNVVVNKKFKHHTWIIVNYLHIRLIVLNFFQNIIQN